jgi:hypothetical protein
MTLAWVKSSGSTPSNIPYTKTNGLALNAAKTQLLFYTSAKDT